MHGPHVAPWSLGKQNLLLHTIRQLEKHFFVDHQTFRLGVCSHDTDRQEANATVIIVQNTETDNVGLELVRVYYQSIDTTLVVHSEFAGCTQHPRMRSVLIKSACPDFSAENTIACML